MSSSSLAILGLGVLHGINPGMGWLFAVGLGLQEGEGRAVWRALPPLAAGHGLAIAGAVGAGLALGAVVPPGLLKWGVAAVLVGFGLDRLFRGRHPRWVGMRVGARDLTLWSLLMASAHGAGLMVLPFLLGSGAGATAGPGHQHHLAAIGMAPPLAGVLATLLHTAGYLLTTTLLAWLVYSKLGLRRLGRLWINLDLVWGVVLVATGLLTPVI